MSKCREAFDAHYAGQLVSPFAWDDWQACWNARGKVDAEICRARAKEMRKKIQNANPLTSESITIRRESMADEAFDCAEVIEQEQV